MKCTYCSEITKCSCSDHESEKYQEAEYVCDVCTQLLDEGVVEDELKTSSKREETKKIIMIDNVASVLASRLMEENFDAYWQEEKEDLRSLSKKELAVECHYSGLHTALVLCIQMHLEGKLSELFEELKEGMPKKEIESDNK